MCPYFESGRLIVKSFLIYYFNQHDNVKVYYVKLSPNIARAAPK